VKVLLVNINTAKQLELFYFSDHISKENFEK